MLLDTSFCLFFSPSNVWQKSLKPCCVTWPQCGVRQLAQYCETGGAVDSMLEVFIVNCLFLYRSKVRVQMTKHLLHICELYMSFQLRLEELMSVALELFGISS